jgi:hypothetical protein
MSKRRQKQGLALPKLWPDSIVYLDKPVQSASVSAEICELLNKRPASAHSIPNSVGPCSRVRISPIHSPDHPANEQCGLFASQHLEAGSFILFYLGFVHGNADSDPTSDYDLSLDRELGIGIDATNMGNESRFINDYRGITAAGPNAEFNEVWVDLGKGLTEKRMAVYVLQAGKSGKRAKGIKKGEEILVSYGKGFWNERNLDDNTKLISDATIPD